MEVAQKGGDLTKPSSGRKLEIWKIYKALMRYTQPDCADKNWSKIWRIKGPLRLNLCLWFIRHDNLPIANLLFKLSCEPSPGNTDSLSQLRIEEFGGAFALSNNEHEQENPERGTAYGRPLPHKLHFL
ncbi:hypothetical protein M9H77_07832 [Catharanthus roseus]|uniref:Uncharacterized protein n=1 Tax=Catharanthus roseus TaxID=4058 RepID=A0ACC0BW13_CATRO|nr:hypothetical protein M9H77_07832 [Catharanthus roseus]